MKKLALLFTLTILCLGVLSPNAVQAATNISTTAMHLQPNNQGLSKKARKQKLRQLRKKYRKDIKGMTKTQKRTFLESKLTQPDRTSAIPYQTLLVVGIIFLLVSIILGLILESNIFYAIGVIILVIWLILFLLDHI